MSSAPRIFIATPTMGTVKTTYMHAIIATIADLSANGIASDFYYCDGSNLVLQRNFLATRFFNDRTFTHIFFTDSDMAFAPDLCRALLAYDKPVIGTIAARKSFDYSKVVAAIKAGVDPSDALSFGFSWVAVARPGETMPVENWLLKQPQLGFGAILIHRFVLAEMIAAGAAVERHDPKIGDPYFNFFGPRPAEVASGEVITEDISFCRRWSIDCGGELVAMTNANIYHIGDFGYGGSFHNHLEAQAKLQKRETT